jgi:hypothetical protein
METSRLLRATSFRQQALHPQAVMMRLVAYDDTLPGLSMNTCLMHPGVNSDRKDKHVLVSGTDTSVSVTIKYDTSIDSEHIVFHEWVIDMLKVERGQTIIVEPIEPVVIPVKVGLEFVAFQSTKDLEDVDCFGPIYLPFCWYTCWPEELKHSSVERAAVLSLMGSILCDGAIVAVRHLDLILVRQSTSACILLYCHLFLTYHNCLL